MYSGVKRVLDIIIATVALLILLPLFLPIVILLLLTGEHEVFYGQERVGYKNRPFRILKFATMLKNSPNLGPGDVTVRNDPRVTSVGKFLRISKLNELPQLLNIIRGDMSIVGPRPLMKKSFERYSPDIQARVYNVRPGLTGIGSLIFRDEEALVTASGMDPHDFYLTVIMPHKGALEIWYQEHISLYTDLMIMFLTAWYIIFPSSNLVHKVFRDLPVFGYNRPLVR